MAKTDFFKKERERTQRLWKELASAEIVDLLGVIRPRGVAGSHSQGDKQWTLQIELLAWRAGDGAVSKQPLVARKKMGERTIASMMKKFDDYEVVRMRARVAEKNSFGSPQAEIVRMPEPSDDREMLKLARSLKKPVRLKDDRLGTLTLDRASGSFDAKTKWGERRVSVMLGAGRDGAPDESLRHARALFRAPRKWQTAVMREVAGLYGNWRNVWWIEGEKLLNEKQFAAKVRLENIMVEPDGSFVFEFDDADLFGGHSVVVRGSLKTGVKEATIEG